MKSFRKRMMSESPLSTSRALGLFPAHGLTREFAQPGPIPRRHAVKMNATATPNADDPFAATGAVQRGTPITDSFTMSEIKNAHARLLRAVKVEGIKPDARVVLFGQADMTTLCVAVAAIDAFMTTGELKILPEGAR